MLMKREKFGHFIIEVIDNGPGIEKNQIKQIFIPFKQGHFFASQGVGLGLALVKDVIEKHSGKIFVNSKENEYTEFRIIIPFMN